ncbi:6-pyruvoyl trahydropterin synthase family protein [Bryobacter aggregatus]|uniref:6-pyruvoyl trahydropterin synthase family protein n=1 Tax=Bryobacter aggregatus TaxID=360054 RepID=UPI0004E20060|nr:6-carboxytetrahydropterin synthase [Bryobacter aggregatus]
MLITRRVEFSASHRCAVPGWTDEQNQAVFGPEASRYSHGHNYVLEVTLSGEVDPVTGMIVDLKDVKEVLHREVVDPMDHRDLNAEVPPFDHIVPTPENIAMEIWRRIVPHFSTPTVSLHEVRLYETEHLYVEYRGE